MGTRGGGGGADGRVGLFVFFLLYLQQKNKKHTFTKGGIQLKCIHQILGKIQTIML